MTLALTIMGAGSVGRALATGASNAGYDVRVGVRDPRDPRHVDLHPIAQVLGVADAAREAPLLVLAVPASALADLLASLDLDRSTIVVDATNAVGVPVPGGFDTVAEHVASLLPEETILVKAFNTIGAEHLRSGRLGGDALFLPIAGDDAGRPTVRTLGEALGFAVADLGGRDAIRLVEDHARLWIHLAFRCGWGRDFGFVAQPR